MVTVDINPETRKMLKEIGRKGDTYDEIIKRLISLDQTKADSE